VVLVDRTALDLLSGRGLPSIEKFLFEQPCFAGISRGDYLIESLFDSFSIFSEMVRFRTC
jgi:hypothetical protein